MRPRTTRQVRYTTAAHQRAECPRIRAAATASPRRPQPGRPLNFKKLEAGFLQISEQHSRISNTSYEIEAVKCTPNEGGFEHSESLEDARVS